MKSLINMRAGAMMLMLMFLSGTSAWADVDDYLLSVRDVSHSANTIDFNLYLLDTDNVQAFEFASLQMGLLLNSTIYGGGVLTVSYSNSESDLDGDQQFVGSSDVVGTLTDLPGKTLIRLMPNSIPPVPPGAGSGTVISSTGDGTLLAHFTITSSVSFTPNTRPDLIFCASDAESPLFPTVLSSYINGNVTTLAVNPGLSAIVDGNPLLNATLPVKFNVTGTGAYCQGGEGLPVGLDGSEADVTYELYRDDIGIANYTGSGAALSLGIRTAGTYTVIATNAAGDKEMDGQAVITETVLPTAIISYAGSPFCTSVVTAQAVSISGTGAFAGGVYTAAPAGLTINSSSGAITPGISAPNSYTVTYTIPATGGCPEVPVTTNVTITALPGAAGSISGPASFTPGTSGVGYSVTPISAATSYIWSYSGSGVTINGSGASVTLTFSTEAIAGTLSVYGSNSCGDGSISTLYLSPSTKTLTLTSVLLEGLYNGGGTMREASNSYTPQYPGFADRITIELHDADSYSTLIYSVPNVDLSLIGTATVTIPAAYSGTYYITIKHRNSIETTTASTVSFAGTTISQSFEDRSDVFGDNLKSSGDGYYLIYGADVNQDGLVDTGDMNDVDNGSAAILIGYNFSDANGDGLVDTSDMNMVDNNSAAIVYIRIPL